MTDDSSVPASALLEAHDKLEAAFALHQEALMLLDLPSATEMLVVYRSLLSLHMRHEEDVVLGLFRRAGVIKKWPEVLYTGQHAKMNEHLDRIERAMDQLRQLDGRALRRALLDLFDLETSYKNLVEHHDGAEREGLFPTANDLQTAEERATLIPQLLAEWREAVGRVRPTYERVAQHLDELSGRLGS